MTGTFGTPFHRRHFEVIVIVSPFGATFVPCDWGMSRSFTVAEAPAASAAANNKPTAATFCRVVFMALFYYIRRGRALPKWVAEAHAYFLPKK